MASSPHVLIIVQNLPVPLDRRVWLECRALIATRLCVSVICPKGPGDPSRQHRGCRHLQVPARAGSQGLRATSGSSSTAGSARRGSRSGLAPHVGSTSFRRATPRTPTGRWRGCGAAWRAVRLRPARPQPRTLPVPVRTAQGACSRRCNTGFLAGTAHISRRGPRRLDQRVLPGCRATRGGTDPDDVTVVRSGPDTS